MRPGIWLLGLCLVLGSGLAQAAQTRDELLFAVSAALKTNDRAGLEKCFNFQGVDEEGRATLAATLDQICAWPTRYMVTSERKDRGPLELSRNGRLYTLNGEWTFQIHLHKGKPPSKGYVFPAGQAVDGQFMILASIPK